MTSATNPNATEERTVDRMVLAVRDFLFKAIHPIFLRPANYVSLYCRYFQAFRLSIRNIPFQYLFPDYGNMSGRKTQAYLFNTENRASALHENGCKGSISTRKKRLESPFSW